MEAPTAGVKLSATDELDTQALLRVAGLLAWVTAGLPYALAHLRGHASGGIFLWVVPYVAFLLAFLLRTGVAATVQCRPVPGRSSAAGLPVASRRYADWWEGGNPIERLRRR